ncbi:unnamed protein product [Symbiodinium sp. CCMP2456]|nr:unnamed protein product [Symbiodinium sp. CCMP2456]
MAEKDLVGISAPVGIAELAEVLCRSNELDLEVLFENITSWNTAAHFQDDHEMGDVPNRLVGLIAEASHRSQWDRASVAVYALTGATCLHMQGMTAALHEDTLLLTKLQHSILLAVAAFGEMLDDALLAGSQGSSPSATDFTEKQSLAELVRSLASLLLELLPSLPLAETLLAIPGLPGALLCAASTSLATLGKSSSLLSSSVSFVVLRAQRALADLLTSMLEETSTEVRASQELLLGSIEPGASRLVETLILSRPDPKLHQLLLELLWRALRRVPCPAGSLHAKDAPAMRLFRELAGSRQQQQLQQVSGEQLLEWNLDLALQMNRHPQDVVSLSNCEVAWGSFRAHQCVVTFSSYSFVLEGQARQSESELFSVRASSHRNRNTRNVGYEFDEVVVGVMECC